MLLTGLGQQLAGINPGLLGNHNTPEASLQIVNKTDLKHDFIVFNSCNYSMCLILKFERILIDPTDCSTSQQKCSLLDHSDSLWSTQNP